MGDERAKIDEALQDLARWERHRIQLTCDLVIKGQAFPPSDIDIRGWVNRLVLLESAIRERSDLGFPVNGSEGARAYVSERGRACVGTPQAFVSESRREQPSIA